ncbi:MAG: biotin/lipoyl-containing protein [Anaerolineae bacterium]
MSTKVLVPPLGTTVDTVTFVSWYKQEGDVVQKGEPLYVIETDKANLDIESPADGILRRATAKEGDELKALSVIAFIAEQNEALPELESGPAKQAVIPAELKVAASSPLPGSSRPKDGRIFISPRARRLAEANHVPVTELKPTGPEGAIIERDVQQWLAAHVVVAQAGQTAPQTELTVQPSQPAGAGSSRYMTLTAQVDMTEFVSWHARLLENKQQPSYTSLVLYLANRLLSVKPMFERADVGVSAKVPVNLAYALPAGDDFQYRPLPKEARLTIKELVLLEREAAVVHTGSKTGAGPASLLAVLNLGDYGLDTFTPAAANQVCALLSLGLIHTDGSRKTAWLCLTADSARIAAPQAAEFMGGLVRLIKDPQLVLGI